MLRELSGAVAGSLLESAGNEVFTSDCIVQSFYLFCLFTVFVVVCLSVCIFLSFFFFFYIGFSLFEALTFLVVERVTKLTQKPEVLVIVHR